MKRYIKSSSEDFKEMYPLEVVPECNDENDEPTCWAMRSQYSDDRGRYDFVWITKYDDKEYIIEDSNGNNRTDGKTYKTLRGAWKEAARIMQRRDEAGSYVEI